MGASAGSGGGAGGSGGATGDCTLGTQWENMGFSGAETLGYGNVVLLQNPRDGSLWQVVSRTERGSSDLVDIVKYENGTLESFDIVRYLNETNEIYLRDLVVAPNGKLWTVGQGRDGEGGRWFATIWKEGESGFPKSTTLKKLACVR